MATPKLEADDPEMTALVARFEAVFCDVTLYRKMLALQDSDAQSLLDYIQWLLDAARFDFRFRRSLIVAAQRLSTKSCLYPTCYLLDNVSRESQHPVAAGGFADIYKGSFEGSNVCLKVIRIYESTKIEHYLKRFSKEMILWGQLCHPNVLPIYGLCRLQTQICLVSPWMDHGDVNIYLKTRPEAPRLQLALDVARGLLYLHENKIIHGDLKGPNVLVNELGRACLADFGISSVSDPEILRWTTHSSVASKGGSVRWQAPELIDMENDEVVENTEASDVYAWSCVCYEIFTGDIPFAAVHLDATVMLKVKSGAQPTRPLDSSHSWRDWGLTESIWSLMKHCWSADPSKRPKIEDVIKRLARWRRNLDGVIPSYILRISANGCRNLRT
ncbi:putative protein tyrosine kinase [Lyophyllum shimeji]|uniref:Protein kinase domain-containing protein n=1 Tax=Lyophyllum shimeji TaxID=47721 RepID=A0A9P3Q393_LYOSH|nr:putative protein tyrosine kinase [Lyophyllum shimeji]GLB45754.1 putative protein tyrosine kinase [Lyophyllum shimeji]GLB45871.1 putative protein tyrosine kinase [Lyophyllum shimeji]